MTKRQRAQVVELLRCAADVGSISHADEWFGFVDRSVWNSAFQALVDVPDEVQEYELRLLEAAARVEEGSWP
jgi:hypothetical protein